MVRAQCALVQIVLLLLFPAVGHAQPEESQAQATAPGEEALPVPEAPIREETLSRPDESAASQDRDVSTNTEAPAGDEASSTPEATSPSPEPVQSQPEQSPVDSAAAEAQAEAAEATKEAAPPASSPLLFDGDYLATVDRLRRELRLDPTATEVRFALGQALFGLGELDEALDEFRRVLREHPSSIPARLHLATTLMAKRQWKEAQKELTTVLVQDPNVVAAHHNLATVRYSQGDVRGAIDSFRAALAIAPDSVETRYRLGVVLRLAGRTKEAVPEFEAASEAGHPKAQYFLGAAYASGAGTERDLSTAIRWWMAASEHGVPEAQDALSKLRKTALKSGASKESKRVIKAFQDYRDDLWFEFPELTRNGEEDTVGVALLQAFRIDEAIPTLIREALAMEELSERYLAALYEQGLPPLLKPHDTRILRYFETAAADGAPQPRLALARIHALGLGVSADRGRALTIIKGLPPAYAEQFLEDLATHPAGTAPNAIPQPSESTAEAK